jgi:iron complex outermembrane recepter protein
MLVSSTHLTCFAPRITTATTRAKASRFNTTALCGATAPTTANAPADGQAARAVQIPIGADEPANAAAARANNSQPYGFDIQNHALTLDLDKTALGTISSTLYHQDRSAVTASFNFLRSAQNPPANAVLGFGFNDLKQTRTGLRTTIDTALPGLGRGAKVVWGFDLENQTFTQPNNLGLTATSPDYKQNTYAPFAQLDAALGAWRLSGGLRFERIEVDIPTFDTPLSAAVSTRTVTGGKLTFSEALLNAGAVYNLNREVQAFGSFSQGLTVGELLRAIRSTNKFSVADAVGDIAPVKVDAYEVGLRGFHPGLRWSTAVFYNTSDLGATITRDPVTQVISTVRAPEKVYGVEATADWDLAERWRLGGSISLQEGKRSLNGVTEDLPGTRIAPLKLVTYTRYQWSPMQSAQLDVIHTGGRNKFPDGRVNSVFSANVVGGDAEGAGRVVPVTLVNVSYSRKLGPGRATVSIINLLNKYYIPTTLQALNDPRAYYAGQGRAVGANYTVNW